jgi:hypothetical protein
VATIRDPPVPSGAGPLAPRRGGSNASGAADVSLIRESFRWGLFPQGFPGLAPVGRDAFIWLCQLETGR